MTIEPVPAIVVEALLKVYPGGIRAVDSISFAVAQGEFFGFLGPNGAGKTTTIRILATLLQPSEGHARVLGLDIRSRAAEVRRRVGFAMQTVALDDLATGRENLELIGRLHRVPQAELHRRVDELLELTGLAHVAAKLAGTYSGGMRRRLDLASALVHRPAILFLDEPTEGLDPQSRNALWDELRRVNEAGTTMFLTTHYMEEADRLCSRVAIIDHGHIVAEGTPADLKRSMGDDVVTLTLEATTHDELALQQAKVLRGLDGFAPVSRVERISDGVAIYLSDAAGSIPALLRRLDGDGDDARIVSVTMSQPTLDDVFLRFTGKRIREEEADRPLALWS